MGPHLVQDDRYRVLVGWDAELETFQLTVWDNLNGGEPVLELGRRRREVVTLSQLSAQAARYLALDPTLLSVLRRDAPPLAT